MDIGAPQIIYIVIAALSVGIAIEGHGDVTETSAWHTVIATAIMVALLAWGGFFG